MPISATGSSPLARGTHQAHSQIARDRGLIPARAGNTAQVHAKLVLARAHPRSRGEHGDGDCHLVSLSGSSPLARGTRSDWPLALR